MDRHEALVRMLRESGAVRFGTFTLASGKTSDVYVDIKAAWTDPARLELLGRALADRVGDVDRLAGMELGAVPLLAATSLYARRPFAVVRKAAKGHGTDQRIEGEVPPGARFLVLEDVTTTGGSVADTVALLRGRGAKVDRVLVVVDRGEGARERLGTLGVSLESLATLEELRGAGS
ncbi:MAG: orotate phosphoribosyltransferase [Thermoplasmata archaeon]|nr:orotate phosphoribosyltransferase [Thermoplasmata archaeon]